VSTEQEELITEEDAARYLGVSPVHLIELVTQGELHLVTVQKPEGSESMYFKGEVFRLKERLRNQESRPETTQEWPDTINE
jgi:hypothetical protein